MNIPKFVKPTVHQVGCKVFAGSENVAAVFSKRHDNVLGSIDKLKSQLIENGKNPLLYFKERNYLAGDGKSHRCYDLNKVGFDLLVMGFSGKKAFEFKLAYIEQFNAMGEALTRIETNKLNDAWNKERALGKETHKSYTDVGERFLAYAKAQRGNDRYARRFYSNLGKAKLDALFIFDVNIKTCRDLLTKRQIRSIEQADEVANNALQKGMEDELEHKEIYQRAKKAVIDYGSLIGKQHVPDEQV